MAELVDDLERLATRGVPADPERVVHDAVMAAGDGGVRRPWVALVTTAAAAGAIIAAAVLVGSRDGSTPAVGDLSVPGPPAGAPASPTNATAPETTTALEVVPVTAAAETVPTAVTTLAEPVEVLAIGDSVMLGAASLLSDEGVVVDSSVSRQIADVVALVERLHDQAVLGSAVVVHLGTNGPITDRTLDAFMEPLSDVPNVIVLTVRGDRTWTAGNNELLRALRDRPNVILIDWEQLADHCPGECFYDDGIHLRPDGQRYYTQLILDVLGL